MTEHSLKGDRGCASELAKNTVESGPDGVICIRESGKQTRDTVYELCNMAKALVNEKRKAGVYVGVLVEVCSSVYRDKDAYAEGPAFLRLDCDAMAICGATTTTRVVANWFIKRCNQQHKIRYFQTSERALVWLKQKEAPLSL